MKLLDELRKESETVRLEMSRNLSSETEREAFYETRLQPALLAIRDYLVELTRQLDFLNKDISVPFDIPGYGIVEAHQHSRNLTLDSVEKLTRIDLHTKYHVQDLEFTVLPLEKAEETRSFLQQQKLACPDWPVRGPKGPIMGLRFSFSNLELKGRLSIRADIPNRKIKVYTANLYNFADEEEDFLAEDITEEWLDKLGRSIVGHKNEENTLEITEEEKSRIRQRLAEENSAQQRELERMEQQLQQEQEDAGLLPKELGEELRSRISDIKGGLRKRFGRMDPDSGDNTE